MQPGDVVSPFPRLFQGHWETPVHVLLRFWFSLFVTNNNNNNLRMNVTTLGPVSTFEREQLIERKRAEDIH